MTSNCTLLPWEGIQVSSAKVGKRKFEARIEPLRGFTLKPLPGREELAEEMLAARGYGKSPEKAIHDLDARLFTLLEKAGVVGTNAKDYVFSIPKGASNSTATVITFTI